MVRLLVSKVAAKSSARCRPLPCSSRTMASNRSVLFISIEPLLKEEEIDRHPNTHQNHKHTHPRRLNLTCIIRTTITTNDRTYNHHDSLRPKHSTRNNKRDHRHTVDDA